MKPNVADCQFCVHFSVERQGYSKPMNKYRCAIGGLEKKGRVIYKMDECPGRKIDWKKEISWNQIEALEVIEWLPDRSEFFLTKRMQKALKAAEVLLDEEGIEFRDMKEKGFPPLCVLASFVHLEEATEAESTFVSDFLVRFHKVGLGKVEAEDAMMERFVPGIKWPKT